MIPLAEARAYVLERCKALAPKKIPIAEALGTVLASDVYATEAIPAFANTAMDGFALKAADTTGAPVTLEIVGTVAAGDDPSIEIGPGQAARIMTGAVIPAGADAVVMVERTAASGDEVTVEMEVPEGNHVRPPGDDIEAGQLAFGAGSVVGAGHLGVLASIGHADIEVIPKPRVGVVSTGDELVEVGRPLRPGQIRDSNRRTLLALVERTGAEPVDLGVAPDDKKQIEAAFRRGVETCDVVLSSGGVSMGDFDYVKVVLDDIGDMRWMQIAIKPAKPFAFGLVDSVPVFGLPGNPVSSMVSYELLARPGLRKIAGWSQVERTAVSAIADEPLARKPDGKTYFLRVVSSYGDDGRFHVRSSGGQGSHMLWSMANADALAVVPDGDGVAAGGEVEVLLLDFE